MKRLKRMQEPRDDQPSKPHYVSQDEFFNAPIGKNLPNPNRGRIKRVLVNPN